VLMAVCILVMTFILANGSIEDELFCRNLYLFEMLKRVSIGSHTMNSKMREAVPSSEPQSRHVSKLRFEGFLSCIFRYSG
jgi:hypothetical protein